MKKFGVILALVATFAMSLLQITPSFAADGARGDKLSDLARRGQIAIVTPAQMDALAKSNPVLHAKLKDAYTSQTPPKLTAAEKSTVRRMTMDNLKAVKAGEAPGPAASPSGRSAFEQCTALFNASPSTHNSVFEVVAMILCFALVIPLVIDVIKTIFPTKQPA